MTKHFGSSDMTDGMHRIALLGPMGIGKTTAIRVLCGSDIVSSDVPNLDRIAHTKEHTTVGVEFGEIDLGGGERVQLWGCPGQDRFDFARQWLISVSVGIFVMVDLGSEKVMESATDLLREISLAPTRPVTLILCAREASNDQILSFSNDLLSAGFGVMPVLPVDVRDRNQLLQVLEVLVAMLSLRSELL
ncbi:GTPase [Acidovorax sp. DW039]|uniref:GTP-binding protein n=1 Tax=Acidovorax sp. DW039 TaxID=3095606 RepID=UPI003092D38E|nr:GTPase [Acidovorax sp. DW039]